MPSCTSDYVRLHMWSVHIHSNCRGNVAYQARARDASRSMMTVWISLHVDGRGLAAVYEDVEDETKRWRGMGQPGASEDSRQQAPGRAEQNRKKHTHHLLTGCLATRNTPPQPSQYTGKNPRCMVIRCRDMVSAVDHRHRTRCRQDL